MLKIALLTDGIFPYVIGGMQKHSYYLAKYLARNSIYVHLYHTPFRSPRTQEMMRLSCFTEEEKKYIQPCLIDFPKLGSLPGHYLRESYAYSCLLYEKFLQSPKVDFIYVQGFAGWKLLEEKRDGLKCPPIGVNYHGYEMFQQAASFKSAMAQILFLKKPVLFNCRNADYVFSFGGKVTALIKNKANVSVEKIIEIPIGIEESWLNDSIRDTSAVRKFIFVGR